MSDGVLALVSALSGVFVSGVFVSGVFVSGVFGLVYIGYQQRLQDQSGEKASLARLVTEVLHRSSAFALRVQVLSATVEQRSGLGEGVDVALRVRKPVEMRELYDWLAMDWAPLDAAWSEMWTSANQEIVTATNAVVQAANDVLELAVEPQTDLPWRQAVRSYILGRRWSAAHQQLVDDAVHRLALNRKSLTILAREKLDLPAIDSFIN